jgi:acyl-CoA synthetase (AMP-forming)/AMP-acid ligase II
MVKVEPKQISLTDKLIETRKNKRTVNIVYRGVLETTTWPEIIKLADLYATVLIEQKMTLKTCAMIGQYSKEAFAQYVACIMTGNTVLMLEPDFPDRFDILDDTETEIVIIDKKYLTATLDLGAFSTLKTVYSINSSKYDILTADGTETVALDEAVKSAKPNVEAIHNFTRANVPYGYISS